MAVRAGCEGYCMVSDAQNLPSTFWKVSVGLPRGVLSRAMTQYWADSYTAQCQSTASQLPTCK